MKMYVPNFKYIVCTLCLSIYVELESALASNHDWDVLIFTQHWPISVCMQWKEKQAQHTCHLPSSSSWTIHGIWPTKLGTIGPMFCNHSLHFDPNQLTSIRSNLLKRWPDVYNGTTDDALWKHEWSKHGTCAVVLESLNCESKYFGQGLEWNSEYDMSNILSRAGISPDVKGYTPQQIWDAVFGALGKRPDIRCMKDAKTEEWYLFEVRICFNKELQLIDCDGIKDGIKSDDNILTNCPASSAVIYPGQVPVKEELKEFRAPWLLQFLRIVQWLQWMTL